MFCERVMGWDARDPQKCRLFALQMELHRDNFDPVVSQSQELETLISIVTFPLSVIVVCLRYAYRGGLNIFTPKT